MVEMESSALSALELFISSATPVVEICLMCGVGIFLARKGILDKAGRTTLAGTSFNVFAPAMVYSALASSLSAALFPELLALLLNLSASTLVGLGLGVAVVRLTRAPAALQELLWCCVAFGNVGNLPLVFAAAVCRDPSTAAARALGARCERLGIAYAAFDMLGATAWQFTLALFLIRRCARRASLAARGEAGDKGGRAAQLSFPEGSQRDGDYVAVPTEADGEDLAAGFDNKEGETAWQKARDASAVGSPSRTSSALPLALPPSAAHVPKLSSSAASLLGIRAALPGASSLDSPSRAGGRASPPPSDDGLSGSSRPSLATPQLSALPAASARPVLPTPFALESQSRLAAAARPQLVRRGQPEPLETRRSLFMRFVSTSLNLLPVGTDNMHSGQLGARPTLLPGSLARLWQRMRSADWEQLLPIQTRTSAVAVLVGFVPGLKALFYGPDPPLRLVSDVIQTLGGGMVPTVLMLLGATLAASMQRRRASLPGRVLVGVVLARLVVLPAIMTALLVAAVRANLVRVTDPLYLLTILVSNATPSSLNIQTMAVVCGYGDEQVSGVMLWNYLCSIFTLPVWTWVALRLSPQLGGST